AGATPIGEGGHVGSEGEPEPGPHLDAVRGLWAAERGCPGAGGGVEDGAELVVFDIGVAAGREGEIVGADQIGGGGGAVGHRPVGGGGRSEVAGQDQVVVGGCGGGPDRFGAGVDGGDRGGTGVEGGDLLGAGPERECDRGFGGECRV